MDALEAAGKPPPIIIPFRTARAAAVEAEFYNTELGEPYQLPPPGEVNFFSAGIDFGEEPARRTVSRWRWTGTEWVCEEVTELPPVPIETAARNTGAVTVAENLPTVADLINTGAFELTPTEFESSEEYTPGGIIPGVVALGDADGAVLFRHTWGGWGDDGPQLRPQPGAPNLAHSPGECTMHSTHGAADLLRAMSVDQLDFNTAAELLLNGHSPQQMLGVNIVESPDRRPRPRSADCASARAFNDRIVVTWTHRGGNVEYFRIFRAIDEYDYEEIAQVPADARKFVDYDVIDRDLCYDYRIVTEPPARTWPHGLNHVAIWPAATMSIKERLAWQGREVCMQMFGSTDFPGVAHFREMGEVATRIVRGLSEFGMLDDALSWGADMP